MLKIIISKMLHSSREKLLLECGDLLKKRANFFYLVQSTQLKKTVTKKLIEKFKNQQIVAFLQPEIHLFSSFINEFLKDCALYKKPILASEQKLILKTVTQRLVADHTLTYFKDVIEYDSFYDHLQRWLKEVKGTGDRPEWLTKNLESRKEIELKKIFHAYEDFLHRHSLVDCLDNQQIFLHQINQSSLDYWGERFSQTTLFIFDGFNQMSNLQFRVIKALVRQKKEVVLHILSDETRSELFHSTEEMLEQLAEFAETEDCVCQVIKESKNLRQIDTPLNHLQTSLFKMSDNRPVSNHQIQILEATSSNQEVLEIGRAIRQEKLENPRLKYAEIGVIFNDLSSYQSLIRESFTELAIPYQLSREDKLLKTPIFKLILHIYHVFDSGWSRDSILTMLKSTYLKIIDQKTSGLLEIIARKAGIIKGYSDWKQGLSFFQERIVQEAALRESMEKLQQQIESLFLELKELEKPHQLTIHCQLLWRFLDKYHLTEQILKSTDEKVKSHDLLSLHHLQHLLQRLAAFTQHVEYETFQGKISSRDFLRTLMEGAKDISISEVDLETDAVQIIHPSASSGQSFQLVFIGGLIEGRFPVHEKKDWLGVPAEGKKIWSQAGFSHLLEEKLLFLEAVQTARKKIVFTYPVFLASKTVQPSSFLREVLNIFQEHTIEIIRLIDGQKPKTIVWTESEFEAGLIKELSKQSNPLEAILSMANFSLTDNHRLQRLLLRCQMVKSRASERVSVYDGQLRAKEISAKLAQKYSGDQIYSISQFNEYLRCPFYYFSKRILQLSEVEVPERSLQSKDLGHLYHQILYQFFNDFPGWERETLKQAIKRLQQVSQQVFDQFLSAIILPRRMWSIYQQEILENLEQLLEYEFLEASRQNYQLRPFLLEFSFGLREELQEIGAQSYAQPLIITLQSTVEGEELKLKFAGKIDRIDQSQDGRYLIIYDYKTGKVAKGFDLQLPIYLKAMEQIFQPEKEVIGAGYFSIRECSRKTGIWRDIRRDLLPISQKSKDFFDSEMWQETFVQTDILVSKIFQGMRTGDFRANPLEKCSEYCPYKKICRFQPSRINCRRVNGQEVIGDEL